MRKVFPTQIFPITKPIKDAKDFKQLKEEMFKWADNLTKLLQWSRSKDTERMSKVIEEEVDHGGLVGLTDDDHTQYLKEKASSGLAAETPTHTHQNASNCGQLDHGSALTGRDDDDHSQYHNNTRGDARYLYRENEGAFTPDGNYEPATKKYVDDLVAAAGFAKIKTGTYTGNGVDDRDINIGVDLASKSNAYLIIKHRGTSNPRHRTEYSQGDLAMSFGPANDSVNMIQAFTSTGFQVGDHIDTNGQDETYRYIAIWTN